MKTFHISNYERSGSNAKAIAISNEADIPDTYAGDRDLNLSPTAELLDVYHQRQIDDAAYAERYLALLAHRGITAESLAAEYDDGTIFVCYDYEDGPDGEGDEDGDSKGFTCHRYILAKWLNDSGAAQVTEI